jgi:protein TilB
MSRLTEELLKKSAEHNEGRLTNLEEVSLHQRELTRIENLDKLCRHLKILYL